MRELTKFMMSYTWAMSMFGVQQAVNLLTPGRNQWAKATKAFDNVTKATTGTFDKTLNDAFATGDQVQQRMVDMMFGGSLSGLDPNRWMQTGSDAMARMTDLGKRAADCGGCGQSGQRPADPAAHAASPHSPDSGWGSMPH